VLPLTVAGPDNTVYVTGKPDDAIAFKVNGGSVVSLVVICGKEIA
jgi:hypothetical protein